MTDVRQDPDELTVLVVDAGGDESGVTGPRAALADAQGVETRRLPSPDAVRERLADAQSTVDCVVTGHRSVGVDASAVTRAVSEVATHTPTVVFVPVAEADVASDVLGAGADDVVWYRAGAKALVDRVRAAVGDARARAADRAAVDRFERLLHHLPGVVYRCRTDTGWPFEFLSPGCESLTGYARDVVVSGEVSWETDIIHQDDRERCRRAVSEALDADESFQVGYRIRTAGGEVRHVWEQGAAVPERAAPGSMHSRHSSGTQLSAPETGAANGHRDVDDEAGTEAVYLEGYITDVTQLRERERELVEQSNLLDAIFEQVPVHLFVKDEDARHVRVSEFFKDSNSFLGKTDAELDGWDEEKKQETTATDRAVIETGEPVVDEEEYLPETEQWLLTSKVPWRGADGEVQGLIGVSRDITELKRQREALRRQNERLEEFASVVTHDLRNPLSVASGYVELARERCQRSASTDTTVNVDGTADEHGRTVSESLEAAAEAIDRMDDRIDEVLAFAQHGRTVVEPEPIDLDSLLAEAWDAVGGGNATVKLRRDSGLGTVAGDPDRTGRMLENLLANAREHATSIVRVGQTDDGFYVADDGPGIELEDPNAVFDRGVSTGDDGVGLGLAVVREIVQAHGWSITVGNTSDGGARFEVADVDQAADQRSQTD